MIVEQIEKELECVVSEPFQGGFQKGERLTLEILREIRCLTGRRKVWHVCRGEQEFLVKCFLPHRKQRRNVCREWTSALFLDQNGVHGGAPLFKAVRGDGAICVVYEFLVNAGEVSELVKTESPEVVGRILKKLVKVHEQMHQLGTYQSDNHLANYLWLNGEIYVIDMGSVVLKKAPLAQSKRAANLAKLLTYTSARFHAVLFNEIRTSDAVREWIKDKDAYIEEISKRTAQRTRSRLAHYLRKTRRTTEQFIHEVGEMQEWYAHRELNETTRDKYMSGQEASLSFSTRKKFELKKFSPRGLWSRLKGGSLLPEAVSEWSKAQALFNFEVAVARPHLCVVNRKGTRDDLLLVQKIEGKDLSEEMMSASEAGLTFLVRQLVELLLVLGSMGSYYEEIEARDLIVDSEGELWLVNTERVFFRREKKTGNLIDLFAERLLPQTMSNDRRRELLRLFEVEVTRLT